MKPWTIVFLLLLSIFGFSPNSRAGSLIEDFEGSSAGSSTPPSGWSLVTIAGAPSYATTNAGLGSNGLGGNSGLGGQVSSTDFTAGISDLPGAYLVNNQDFDLMDSLSGTFDFQIVHEGTFDDVVFLFGAIAGGITTTTAGELLSVKIAESASGGVAASVNDGLGTRLNTTGTLVLDDTWYRASILWTPTSGTTGNYSVTVNNFASDVYTISTTGFTFDSATAQIGFGSVNDTIRFDNVSFTGTTVPEPGVGSLLLFGLAGLLRRRR